MLFYILPTGIIYFIILDLCDSLLSLIRVVLIFHKNWSIQRIREFEQSFASKMGMSRMSWQGFKRQRSIAQITFESFPQLAIQFILLFGSFLFFADNQDVNDFVGDNEVLISAIVAVCNSSLQFARIYCEAVAVEETFIIHALNCAMGRYVYV